MDSERTEWTHRISGQNAQTAKIVQNAQTARTESMHAQNRTDTHGTVKIPQDRHKSFDDLSENNSAERHVRAWLSRLSAQFYTHGQMAEPHARTQRTLFLSRSIFRKINGRKYLKIVTVESAPDCIFPDASQWLATNRFKVAIRPNLTTNRFKLANNSTNDWLTNRFKIAIRPKSRSVNPIGAWRTKRWPLVNTGMQGPGRCPRSAVPLRDDLTT